MSNPTPLLSATGNFVRNENNARMLLCDVFDFSGNSPVSTQVIPSLSGSIYTFTSIHPFAQSSSFAFETGISTSTFIFEESIVVNIQLSTTNIPLTTITFTPDATFSSLTSENSILLGPSSNVFYTESLSAISVSSNTSLSTETYTFDTPNFSENNNIIPTIVFNFAYSDALTSAFPTADFIQPSAVFLDLSAGVYVSENFLAGYEFNSDTTLIPPVTANVNPSSSFFELIFDDRIVLVGEISAFGFYSQENQIEIFANYDFNNTFIDFQFDIPNIVDVSSISVEYDAITAETHAYNSFNVFDSSSYSPPASGFSLNLNIANNFWYQPLFVQSWAPLTDLTTLSGILGNQNGVYQVDNIDSGVFNGSNINISYQNSEGTDELIILTETDSIGEVQISPLSGYYNHTIIDLTYSAFSCSAAPSAVNWQVWLNTFNTLETQLLTSTSGAYQALSSIQVPLNSSLLDVGRIIINVNGDQYIFGKYYSIPEIREFSTLIQPVTGYVNATPFNASSTFITEQQHINNTINNIEPAIISPIQASYSYELTAGTISAILPEVNIPSFFTQSFLLPDTSFTISQSIQFLDIPVSSITTNNLTIFSVDPPEFGPVNVTFPGFCNNNYFGGNIEVSGQIVSFGLPFVVALSLNNDLNILGTSDQNNFNIILDIDATSQSVSAELQLSLYPLLTPINPLLSNAYLNDYIDTGLDPISFNLPPINIVPNSHRASLENLNILTNASDANSPNVEVYTGQNIDIEITTNQFNTIPKDINTSLSFNNKVAGCESGYNLFADFNGNILSGQTITFSFTKNDLTSVVVPVTATDGFNTILTEVIYNFTSNSIVTPAIIIEAPVPISNAGCPTPQPMKVIVWDNIQRDNHSVILYSRNSKSFPYQDNNNRNNHLIPQWRFLDLNGNVIQKIEINSVKVYDGTEVIGVSGYAEFLYQDDLPSDPTGVLLIATVDAKNYITPLDDDHVIDLPGYSNSKLSAVHTYLVNRSIPNILNINRDGLREYRPYYWNCGKIPYTITFGSTFIINDCNPVIFNFPEIANQSIEYEVGLTIPHKVNRIDETFIRFDENELLRPGFARGTIIPCACAQTAQITASTTIELTGVPFYMPFAWIMNPIDYTINRVTYVDPGFYSFYTDCLSGLNVSSFNTDCVKSIEVPRKTTADFPEVTGMAGVFGVAINNNFEAWITESELDKVYKISTSGSIIQTIDLPSNSVPAGIALDSNNNFYVTLSETILTKKFNSGGTFLYDLTHPSASANVPDMYKPSAVDTDSQDNVYIAYYNNDTTLVSKFDSTGNHLYDISFATTMGIESIVVRGDDSLCVAYQFDTSELSYPDRHFNGRIAVYDSTGGMTALYSNLNNPHKIAFDNNNDIWFSHGVASVSKIVNGNIINIHGTSTPQIVEAAGDGDHKITGLGATLDNKMYIINGAENLVYVYDINSNSLLYTLDVIPNSSLLFYNNGGTQYEVFDPNAISAAGYGDWTGFNYTKKFIFISDDIQQITLYGESSEFEILCEPEDIRIINDSYNLSEKISALFRPEHLSKDALPVFHNDYLKSILGTNESQYQSISRQFYEKIANFVLNHSDIETCDVNQFYNHCKSLDFEIDDYHISSPADFARLLRIFSVHYQKLRGVKDGYNMYFNPDNCNLTGEYTTSNHRDLTLNRGFTPLTLTTNISAGQGLVVFDKISKSFDLIYSNETTQLSGLSGFGLREPLIVNDNFNSYDFFEYIPNNTRNIFKNNVIDWDNQLNTLSFELSAYEDWYKDFGLVERQLDYQIYKGLGLLDCSVCNLSS